jgi:hypothetical protein
MFEPREIADGTFPDIGSLLEVQERDHDQGNEVEEDYYGE